MVRKIDFVLAAIHAAVATGNSEIENADSLRAAYNEQVNERGVDTTWERDFRPEVRTLRNITEKYWGSVAFNRKQFNNACKVAYKKVRADKNDPLFSDK